MRVGQRTMDAPGTGVAAWLRLPGDRRALRRRAVRDGLVLAGLMVGAFILVVIPAVGRSLGYDAASYWFADLLARYEVAETGPYALGAFRYTPPVGLAFSAFWLLPWWAYLTVWLAAMTATAVWLGGRWALLVLAFPPVALELYHGNVHLFLAAAVALGFRHPSTWAFVALTKVTPVVGLAWFAVRREWRPLGVALGATLAIASGSWVVAPGLWGAWLEATLANVRQPAHLSIPPPIWIRLPLALLLVTWGARTDRRWTVPVAATLALPNLWPHGLAVLAAVPSTLPLRAPVTARGYLGALAVGVGVAALLVLAGAPWVEPLLTHLSRAVIPAR